MALAYQILHSQVGRLPGRVRSCGPKKRTPSLLSSEPPRKAKRVLRPIVGPLQWFAFHLQSVFHGSHFCESSVQKEYKEKPSQPERPLDPKPSLERRARHHAWSPMATHLWPAQQQGTPGLSFCTILDRSYSPQTDRAPFRNSVRAAWNTVRFGAYSQIKQEVLRFELRTLGFKRTSRCEYGSSPIKSHFSHTPHCYTGKGSFTSSCLNTTPTDTFAVRIPAVPPLALLRQGQVQVPSYNEVRQCRLPVLVHSRTSRLMCKRVLDRRSRSEWLRMLSPAPRPFRLKPLKQRRTSPGVRSCRFSAHGMSSLPTCMPNTSGALYTFRHHCCLIGYAGVFWGGLRTATKCPATTTLPLHIP